MPELTIDQAFQLALLHHQAGRTTDAEPIYRQILKLQPGHTDSMHLLGLIALHTDRPPAALDLIRSAISLRPNVAIYHNSLGQVLEMLGQTEDADAACRTALQLDPNYPEAHNNLGNILGKQEEYGRAIPSYLSAIRLSPDYAAAHSNLGNAHKEEGEIDEALASYRRALALQPDTPFIHSNLLLAMHYHPELTPAAIAAEHGRWSERHAQPLVASIQPHANNRQPDRRLRIGYVSPDFRDHAVARFLLPLLQHHHGECFEVYAYAAVPRPDAITDHIKKLVEVWRDIRPLSDAQAAELIREDKIDILVDLAGHTGSNRLVIFAHKPAPIQVSWLGYPNTAGLHTIDYRLTDTYADPPGASGPTFPETLHRLPQGAWCFAPGENTAIAGDSPTRPLTFGSFNTFAKLNSPLLRVWARILAGTPGSRLLIKTPLRLSDQVQKRVRQILKKGGVESGRVEFRGRQKERGDHLHLFNEVDIVLDTFPYHGTTTTCEALWMGRPVVCLVGPAHVSRVGLSLLTNAGFPEWAAKTEEEYVRAAVTLARDRKSLAHLHTTMRAQVEASPLMDAPGFARDVETAFRTLWHAWCKGASA